MKTSTKTWAPLLLAAAAAGAAAQPVDYAFDLTHTFASFEVLRAGTSTVRGRWDRKQGTLQIDRAAKRGRVEITVDMASINTGVPALNTLLQGPEVFDAAAHPEARFVGERFVFDGDRVAEVAGTLTLRGQARPLTLKATRFNCYTSPLFKREVCGGDFEATLARSAWGLGAGLPATVADDVRLLVQVEAVRP